MSDEFSGDPAEFEVVDGIMHCKWQGKRPDLCIPLRVFRVNLARASEAVAEYDRGNVYSFPRPTKRKPGAKAEEVR